MLQRLHIDLLHRHPADQTLATEEFGNVFAGRMREDRLGRVVLGDLCLHLQKADAVADHHRLIDVVRYEDNGLAHRALDADELLLQPLSSDAIDGAKRLVHQKDWRVGSERARKADALPLATRELVRIPIAILARVEPNQLQQLLDARLDPSLVPIPESRHCADVVADGHVRKEACVLDHVAHLQSQLRRIDGARVLSIDEDSPAVWGGQPVDHPQGRRLAAARRSDEDARLAARNIKGQVSHRVGPAGELFIDVLQANHGVVYRNRMPAGLLLAADPWINWGWLSSHVPLFEDALQQHLTLTLFAILGGLVISLPLGVAAHRWGALRNPVLAVSEVFYTIPSIALFALLIPYTGLTAVTAEIGLIGYTVLILVRNVMVGLEAVPPDVIDAANGMGYRPLARLVQIELPLALPAIIAGIRIATVTTIGLVTITALIGLGGLGQLILRGFIENFHTPLVVATVLSIALALIADLALAGAQRLVVPWART